ncbi:hypothetical protein M406DRAFT_67859 [Cryphonectria parasitica EP155]|uniref:Uncharacterized protein n=1 Tax=Cryphonectria parasitica (strain ATCC 38755 / EP155) TaxID=660469 RepID=A0A9P4Y2T8_CRYP1|nr:uncharacterized protein M406DRAFT_67859 [Cryphonectria parasitica EP155]KAF3765415.1 hypothetical protein M406DRAFT_67859 [Cryphonectria parasitica EP155]
MLEAIFEAPLLRSLQGGQTGHFAHLETWKYVDVRPVQPSFAALSVLVHPMKASEVEDWAWRRGNFSDISKQHAAEKNKRVEGGIRLLFVQPMGRFARAVPSELTSAKVLEALRLPPYTFTTFQQPSGLYSCSRYPEGSTPDSCTRLHLTFRTPEKWDCSIGGLAVSHDFETGITTALSLGFAFDINIFDTPANRPPALDAFVNQLQASQHLLCHPFLLPCLALATHVQRVRSYVMGFLSSQVVEIEACIGVTKAGRSQKLYLDRRTVGSKLFVDGQMHRERAKSLMTALNDVSTWIIFTKRSPQWDIGCVNFLLTLLEKSKKLQNCHGVNGALFQEPLEYLKAFSETCLEVTETSEARMHLQLNIDDGQTSARLAVSAGKDSTSMKIIALITAAYLPGTFVATLFSMGMFNWKANDGSGSSSSSISPDFWIYWAVTVPLTIVTLVGWAIWWKFEEYRYDRDIQQAARDQTPLHQKAKAIGEVKLPWSRWVHTEKAGHS